MEKHLSHLTEKQSPYCTRASWHPYIYGEMGIPQRFMKPGFHKLVSNLCDYKTPTALLVSASAAVTAKPQPRRVSIQDVWQTTAKENVDRMEKVSSGALSRLSAANFQFLLHYPRLHLLSIYASCLSCTSHSYPSILSSFLLTFLCFCPYGSPPPLHSPCVCCTLSTPYVSLPGRRCQQLEHITANCATCGPQKARKKGGWGSKMPMELRSVCMCRKHL